MDILINVLKVIHIMTAILMAWPFYALVAVNQRIRLGSPFGDRTDTDMENIIKNRAVPCFVFQATALITRLALVLPFTSDCPLLRCSPFWMRAPGHSMKGWICCNGPSKHGDDHPFPLNRSEAAV